jgi:hypothetical protein
MVNFFAVPSQVMYVVFKQENFLYYNILYYICIINLYTSYLSTTSLVMSIEYYNVLVMYKAYLRYRFEIQLYADSNKYY